MGTDGVVGCGWKETAHTSSRGGQKGSSVCWWPRGPCDERARIVPLDGLSVASNAKVLEQLCRWYASGKTATGRSGFWESPSTVWLLYRAIIPSR